MKMMHNLKTLLVTFICMALVLISVHPGLACGPADLLPVFDADRTPEYPYKDYAAGNLGIVSPKYPRIVLYAAYRYLGGGTFSTFEREKLVEAWMEFFHRESADNDKVTQAVKDWIAERASVIGEEEKPPDIYVEKPYEGFDFFPNCSKNAFEVAKDTLSDRALKYGSEDPSVREWVNGQDIVFRNCADSRALPKQADGSMPEWLQKDRAYQIAAAEFYSLNYEKAKDMFAQIALDPDSPWQQVCEYLVPRTLVRQASLSKNKSKSSIIYSEAQQSLENIYSGGGDYADDANRLLGLVKYRVQPEQRVQELAQDLSFYGGDDLKQNLIDYTWLLDKFESRAMEAEEKRKEKEKQASGAANANTADLSSNSAVASNRLASDSSPEEMERAMAAAREAEEAARKREQDEQALKDQGYLKIDFYDDNYTQSWTIWVRTDASDEEAYGEAAKVAGPLSDPMKERIRYGRQSAYQSLFLDRAEGYEGGYYGEVEESLEILPPFLLSNDLSEWLFTFQIQSDAAYEHSLDKYKQTNSDLWLITALSKAKAGSREVNQLLESAKSIPFSSPAFPTAAYHRARVLIDLGKIAEARSLLDDSINSGAELPVSARNELLAMRMKLAVTLDDFLKYALRKPFAFEWATEYLNIEEMIERQKSYYDPEYYTESREEYERSIDEEYGFAKEIQSEPMFDQDSIEIINNHFPLPILIEAGASPVPPEYLKGRFALAIWTRAALLQDFKTADRFAPEVIKYHEEMTDQIREYQKASTGLQKEHAALFAILKHGQATPYIASGFGTPSEGITYSSKWWCETSDEVWNDDKQEMVPIDLTKGPAFLSTAETAAAQAEMKSLRKLGDAPAYLAEQAIAWAAKYPRDPRVPEALFLAYQANEWDKYGCGGDNDLREKVKGVLMRVFPSSSWAQRTLNDEQQ